MSHIFALDFVLWKTCWYKLCCCCCCYFMRFVPLFAHQLRFINSNARMVNMWDHTMSRTKCSFCPFLVRVDLLRISNIFTIFEWWWFTCVSMWEGIEMCKTSVSSVGFPSLFVCQPNDGGGQWIYAVNRHEHDKEMFHSKCIWKETFNSIIWFQLNCIFLEEIITSDTLNLH